MVDVLKFVPALLIVMGPPFIAGCTGRPAFGVVWTGLFVALAAASGSMEPDSYDMPGFGLRLSALCAGLAGAGLLLGAGLRRLRR